MAYEVFVTILCNPLLSLQHPPGVTLVKYPIVRFFFWSVRFGTAHAKFLRFGSLLLTGSENPTVRFGSAGPDRTDRTMGSNLKLHAINSHNAAENPEHFA